MARRPSDYRELIFVQNGGMQLPVMPPVLPMLAKPIKGFDQLPPGEFQFEGKWDGSRHC